MAGTTWGNPHQHPPGTAVNPPAPAPNVSLVGSYTRQDYVDSMEGATMRELLAAAAILNRPARRLATSAAVA